jgi:hypothetical protein
MVKESLLRAHRSRWQQPVVPAGTPVKLLTRSWHQKIMRLRCRSVSSLSHFHAPVVSLRLIINSFEGEQDSLDHVRQGISRSNLVQFRHQSDD